VPTSGRSRSAIGSPNRWRRRVSRGCARPGRRAPAADSSSGLCGHGVEAPKDPADSRPGADDRAVHVEGEPRQVPARRCLSHRVAVEGDEGRQRLLGEPAEPIGDRRARQAAEPCHWGVAAEKAHVLQAPGADVEQGQDDQREAGAAVVTAQPPEASRRRPTRSIRRRYRRSTSRSVWVRDQRAPSALHRW
jgi:hypothetical protein